MQLHSDESIERAVLTLREMTQERRGRGIGAVMMLEEQIKALESLRKDAERYRWLRDEGTPYALMAVGKEHDGNVRPFYDADLDAAIDAAMADRQAVGAA